MPASQPGDQSSTRSAPAHRVVEVPGERLARWVAGFGERHGAPTVRIQAVRIEGVHIEGAAVTLEAPDGALAVMERPFGGEVTDDWLAELATQARLARNAAVLLIRRGGYAVGVLADGQLVAHKVGTRYVQSRTAAGGWSQQRFARRRDGQAKALVGVTRDVVARLIDGLSPAALIVGGDRPLVAEVLADPRLRHLDALPRRNLWDVGDPRVATLTTVADRATRVAIRLNDLA